MQIHKGVYMKPQDQQQQQPKSTTPQSSETESRGRSPQADGTWNDRDKSSSLTPKDRSPASTKQYDDIKPRDSKFNATDIDKSSRKLDEDMQFNKEPSDKKLNDDVTSGKKDDDQKETGARFSQNNSRTSDRKY
jgi:hypothetical protein